MTGSWGRARTSNHGLIVQREDACLARRRSGFESLSVHHAGVAATALHSLRKRDEAGSIPVTSSNALVCQWQTSSLVRTRRRSDSGRGLQLSVKLNGEHLSCKQEGARSIRVAGSNGSVPVSTV